VLGVLLNAILCRTIPEFAEALALADKYGITARHLLTFRRERAGRV
jgi:3-hydroxyisobutyrate dehydrogenase-like beta-hydroxyacid dehydrogenase